MAQAGDKLVAFALRGRALPEDCRRANLVVSLEPLRWRRCAKPALVIDRFDLWRHGAHAGWLNDGALTVQAVAEGRDGRPWGAGRSLD